MCIRPVITGLALAGSVLFGPAFADDPVTAEEFRAFSEGYTLHVEDETGQYFGSEQYPGDNQAIWLPAEGECLHGVWAPVKDKICFLYETGDLSCWKVFRDGSAAMRFQSVPAYEDVEHQAPEAPASSLILRLTKRDKRPIICPEGPGV